jgi:hypothetical protein
VLRSVYVFQPLAGTFHVQIIPGASGVADLLFGATDTGGRVTPTVIPTVFVSKGSTVSVDATVDTATDGYAILSVSSQPPTVQSLLRLGFHRQATQITLTFSGQLNTSTATRTANYQVVAPGRDGRFGTQDDKVIAIAPAVYNPATNTVTLSPNRRLNLHGRYELIVNGSTSTGVANVFGNLLDGNGDGRPGGNYAVVLRGFGIDKPQMPFNKLIKAQLGGKRMSSRMVNVKTSSTVSHQAHPGPARTAAAHSSRHERTPVPHGPLSSRRTKWDSIRGVKIAHNTPP